MSAIYAQESYVNASEGYRFGDSDIYETSFDFADLGAFYRACRKEYGGCTSKVYRDTRTGAVAIGWVFQRWERYEDARSTCRDCGETICRTPRSPDHYCRVDGRRYRTSDVWYKREVWVTLHDKPADRRIAYHYHEMDD